MLFPRYHERKNVSLNTHLNHKMKTFSKIFLIMAIGMFGLAACQAKAPKGKLIYCSYASSGSAGLGKDYCELIADPGKDPVVRVVLHEGNRFGDPEIDEEYPVTPEQIASLQEWLQSNKVYKLDGYRLDEAITGGYAHRIYMEYDSGDKVDARWYGSKVKDLAITAYNHIEFFFKPWVDRAEKENPSGDPAL